MNAKELVASAGEAVGEVYTEVVPEDWGRHERMEFPRVQFYGVAPPAGTKLYAVPDPMLQRVVEALEKLATHVRPTCSDLYDEAIAALAEARKVLAFVAAPAPAVVQDDEDGMNETVGELLAKGFKVTIEPGDDRIVTVRPDGSAEVVDADSRTIEEWPAGTFKPEHGAGLPEPGTASAILDAFCNELDKRFPGVVNAFASDPFTPKYLAAIDAAIARQQRVVDIPPDGYYAPINTAQDALYEKLCALDNQDVAVEEYAEELVAALARAEFAIVPVTLPAKLLGEAAIAGVHETGNPKHCWDYLVAKSRTYPILKLRAALEGERDGG